MYLTHNNYLEKGGVLEEDAFLRLEGKARAFVDRLTHGRLRDEFGIRRTKARDVEARLKPRRQVREALEDMMFELVEAMALDQEYGGRAVQYAYNDGIGVYYTTQGARDNERRYEQIVRDFLGTETTKSGVGLLYAGEEAGR